MYAVILSVLCEWGVWTSHFPYRIRLCIGFCPWASSLGTLSIAKLQIILRLAPWTGKMNQTLCCDWLPEWARWNYLALLGLPAVSRKKNFPESCIPLYIYPFHSQKEFRVHLKWCWITVARVRVRWRIRLYQWCCASCFMRRNLTRIYMLFAGCEIHIVKNCDRGLENKIWNKIKRIILSRLFPKFVPVEFKDLQTPLSNNEKNIQ